MREYNFSPTTARILTQLITHNYELPQGDPTSTLIANLVFKKTGDKIDKYCKEKDIIFTIFVDDVTLSSKKEFKDKIPYILDIIINDGYKISHKKTLIKLKIQLLQV